MIHDGTLRNAELDFAHRFHNSPFRYNDYLNRFHTRTLKSHGVSHDLNIRGVQT